MEKQPVAGQSRHVGLKPVFVHLIYPKADLNKTATKAILLP